MELKSGAIYSSTVICDVLRSEAPGVKRKKRPTLITEARGTAIIIELVNKPYRLFHL